MAWGRKVSIGVAGIGSEIVCAAALALGATPVVWLTLLGVGLSLITYAVLVGEPRVIAEQELLPIAAGGDGDGHVRGNVFGDNASINIRTGPASPEKPKLISRSPDDLMRIYRDHTNVQAEKLVAPYLGGTMQVSGEVYNVSELVGRYRVSMRSSDEAQYGLLFMDFPAEVQDEVLRLVRGDTIEIRGCLAAVEEYDLTLQDCELVSS